jgi:hypothetical protein
MPIRDPSDAFSDPTVLDALRRMPPVFYKYSGLSGYRLEWIGRLIVQSELYFAPPRAFNDPLDCHIAPNFNASSLVIEQFCRKRRNYFSGDRRDYKKLIRQTIMDSKTEDGQRRLTERLFETLDQNGIACFAKDPANMLLWSYYAEGHSGIAVRFNMAREHLAGIGRQLIPVEVQYSRNFPIISYYKSTTNQLLRTLFGTKSLAWQHEEAWRLVLVGAIGCVFLPPAMIDAVVLGMRTDRNTEATIRGWLKDRVPTVELLRVVHRPRSFVLEVVTA